MILSIMPIAHLIIQMTPTRTAVPYTKTKSAFSMGSGKSHCPNRKARNIAPANKIFAKMKNRLIAKKARMPGSIYQCSATVKTGSLLLLLTGRRRRLSGTHPGVMI